MTIRDELIKVGFWDNDDARDPSINTEASEELKKRVTDKYGPMVIFEGMNANGPFDISFPATHGGSIIASEPTREMAICVAALKMSLSDRDQNSTGS